MNDFERIANILNELSSNNSRNFKKDLLNQYKDNTQLALIFRLTYDPYIRFNVARVVFWAGFQPRNLKDYSFNQFIKDLEILINREKTGNEALDHVNDIYFDLPSLFQPYLEKILQKDLKIGVSTATINEIWPKWIPEFKLGLCERFKKVKTVKYPMFAERKIDGVRVIAFVNPTTQEVRMLSRSGLPYYNFKHIEKELLISDPGSIFFDIERIKEVGIVFDGEIIDKTFQGIMNSARRIYDVNCPDVIFYVWDMLYGDEFFDETCSMSLEERKTGLDLVLFPHEGHIKVMDYNPINSYKELLQCFQEFHFTEGFEGVILKDPKSYYIYSSGSKRGKAWIKFKINDYSNESHELGAEILSVNSGEKGTKYENTLGSFSCRILDLDEVNNLPVGCSEIKFNVGSGLTDSLRNECWNKKDDLIGRKIEVEYQEVSKNNNSEFSLRFPIFIRFVIE